jgi:prophage regulatory protein
VLSASSSDQTKHAPSFSNSRPAAAERLIPIQLVSEQVGMCRSAIYAAVRARAFPAFVKVGRRTRWVESEVQAFVMERAAARSES